MCHLFVCAIADHQLFVQCDPFADVAALLAKELSMDADSKRILLSHRTNPISLTDSPVSLGLTTASIIGEYVVAEF